MMFIQGAGVDCSLLRTTAYSLPSSVNPPSPLKYSSGGAFSDQLRCVLMLMLV